MGILSEGGGGDTTGFATAFMPGRKDSKKKIMVFSLFLSRARGLRQESPFAFVLGMRSCHGTGMYRISKFGNALLPRNSCQGSDHAQTYVVYIIGSINGARHAAINYFSALL